MDNISKRCVVGSKVINNFYNRNIVFTTARFTLYDTEEKYEEFFENPNIIVKSSKRDYRHEAFDKEEHYLSLIYIK